MDLDFCFGSYYLIEKLPETERSEKFCETYIDIKRLFNVFYGTNEYNYMQLLFNFLLKCNMDGVVHRVLHFQLKKTSLKLQVTYENFMESSFEG